MRADMSCACWLAPPPPSLLAAQCAQWPDAAAAHSMPLPPATAAHATARRTSCVAGASIYLSLCLLSLVSCLASPSPFILSFFFFCCSRNLFFMHATMTNKHTYAYIRTLARNILIPTVRQAPTGHSNSAERAACVSTRSLLPRSEEKRYLKEPQSCLNRA